MRLLILLAPVLCFASIVPADLSGVRPGPIAVAAAAGSLVVTWPDETSRTWRAEFSLDPARPLVASIGVEGKPVIEHARPLYWCSTGVRRGGWDQFFDFPPSHPQGTQRFIGEFHLDYAQARTTGDRVEVLFGK